MEGLAQLETLAKRYGEQALRENSEIFIALDNERKLWSERYANEVLDGQLRPKAYAAFRQHKYRQAAEMYERMEPRLSPVELKKLAFAKRHRDG
jgi:hypothetical protein